MADNRGVAYLGKGKVEVQNIEYPAWEIPDGPGVPGESVGPQAPARRDPQARIHEYLRL